MGRTTNPDGSQSQDGVRFKSMADYEIVREIGEGSFATVYKAKEKYDQHEDVAIKMCFKKQIIKEKKVASVHREKNVLSRLSTSELQHPFIVSLRATFQDADHLYFVLSYAKHGDLLHVMLKKEGKRFDLSSSKFYSAELLSALLHLHALEIIHRDVKPENILVTASGHILLSDFGTVKDLNEENTVGVATEGNRIRRNSFVGTAQYVSPEILERLEQTPMCDIWSFAVVVFQFLTGEHCFHDESDYLMFKRIQKLLYRFPAGFDGDAKDLIERILVIEATERLGSAAKGGPKALQNHAFFNGIDWDKLIEMNPPPV